MVTKNFVRRKFCLTKTKFSPIRQGTLDKVLVIVDNKRDINVSNQKFIFKIRFISVLNRGLANAYKTESIKQ